MIGRVARLASPERRERGMTLVELLVAISILAIAVTLITVLVTTLARTFTRQEAQQDSSRTAALAMQNVGRIIRGATEVPRSTSWQPLAAIESARADSIQLYAYVDTATTAAGPSRVTLAIDAATRELRETRVPARRVNGDWVWDRAADRDRVLLRDVAPQGSPLAEGTVPAAFTYLRADGSAIAQPSSGQLTELQRREVVAVCVSLVAQTADGGLATPAQLVSTFSLPNLGLTRAGAACGDTSG